MINFMITELKTPKKVEDMAKVLGMGNALVDILTRIEDDKLLETFGLAKGSMTLVDLDTSNFIHAETAGFPKSKASGGSAANTIHGLAHLGVETAFVGTVGNDDMGRFFKKDLEVNGIRPILYKNIQESGRAMALISKDSERTFATYLGAAVELSEDDITKDIYEGYQYFYIEGYLVQDRKLFEKALRLASRHGLKVCLDLASFNIVESNRDFFLKMIEEYVDILFANEEEMKALYGLSPEEGAERCSEICNTVVVKLGAEGSFCRCGDQLTRIGVRPTEPVDTTGAGDLYASGFIYGHLKGLPAETCGMIGAILSGKVIEDFGAKMVESVWERLRREIKALEPDA